MCVQVRPPPHHAAPRHGTPERAHQKAWPFSQGAKPLNPEALNPFEKFKCFY